MLVKQSPPIGSRPGTLAIPPDSPAPRVYLFEYSPEGVVEREIHDPEELVPFARTEATTWIDIQGLGDEAKLRRIAEIFGLHPLALEDAVNIPQRAKSELYPEHQLLVARAPHYEAGQRFDAPQVCFILAQNYLITFQERHFGFFDPVRERIRAGLGPIRAAGPDYLAYALLDALVDVYYPVVEEISQQLDSLEDEVVEDPGPSAMLKIHHLRRSIAVLRRIGWPQRETLSELLREPSPYIREETRVFLRDTFDHISQIMGRVDFCREVAVGVMDIYLSSVSHRSNEIMKVLTLMASIFIPLTFIAGIYGMNFEYMPELGQQNAYFVVLGVMITVTAGMLIFFYSRGWLGRRG